MSSQAEVLKEMVKKFRLKANTSLPGYGETDPEVIKYMEDVMEKKENNKKGKKTLRTDFNIDLDNEDFGKY